MVKEQTVAAHFFVGGDASLNVLCSAGALRFALGRRRTILLKKEKKQSSEI
jgi:hypothetical protein